jgi:hypothetical protein
MSQLDFSKANGISKSVLYQWNKEFEKENKGIEFSPIVLKDNAYFGRNERLFRSESER